MDEMHSYTGSKKTAAGYGLLLTDMGKETVVMAQKIKEIPHPSILWGCAHSTDNVECELGEKKTPVNAWVFNHDYAIPAGQKAFEANNEIAVPAGIDAGDYHFMVRLTDKSGWQQLAAVSVKIVQ